MPWLLPSTDWGRFKRMGDVKLEISEVMEHLREFSGKELFYRQYGRKKDDRAALDSFLQQYDREDLRRKGIYIEEFLPEAHREFEQEALMWPDPEKSVEAGKYSRFMPHLPAVHDFFEIIYVLENDMPVDLGETAVTLKRGDVCFLPPGMFHCPKVMENTIALQVIIRKSTFHKEFFKSLKGNNIISGFFLNALYDRENSSVLLFHTENQEIRETFLRLYQENYNQCPSYTHIMNSLFEILLCLLLRCDASAMEFLEAEPHRDARIIQILQFIQSNCETVTIGELAEEFHLSKTYLSRYITGRTGKTFCAILQEIRLEKACDMLDTSNLKVEDISASVGYQNVEHFIRLFKRKYHKTPNQYRVSR